MNCPKCGKEIPDGAKFCKFCGAQMGETVAVSQQTASEPQVVDQQPSAVVPAQAQQEVQGGAGAKEQQVNVTIGNMQPVVQKNGIGTAGFVLALIGIFLGWVPILGWIDWFLGAVLSIIGIFRTPRGLAIAGTVLSFIDLILLMTLFGGLAMFGASMKM